MYIAKAVEFFLNGFSQLGMPEKDMEISMEQDEIGTFDLGNGSWEADFRKDGDDLLARYSDSGGDQGWVRISQVQDGYQVLHSDWERCFGNYAEADEHRSGNQVLRTCWSQTNGIWQCWTSQVLGWDGELEEGEPADYDRVVRPPHVLDRRAAYTAHMNATEGPANPLPVQQDTVPVHILTAADFDGKACEYSTGITVHTIQKFVAWSEDAMDLQVCTRPECIEKLCVEADKNRIQNLPKDLDQSDVDADPGLEGFDGNPDTYYELVELVQDYDKADEGEDEPYTAMELKAIAAVHVVEAVRRYLGLPEDTSS